MKYALMRAGIHFSRAVGNWIFIVFYISTRGLGLGLQVLLSKTVKLELGSRNTGLRLGKCELVASVGAYVCYPSDTCTETPDHIQ